MIFVCAKRGFWIDALAQNPAKIGLAHIGDNARFHVSALFNQGDNRSFLRQLEPHIALADDKCFVNLDNAV